MKSIKINVKVKIISDLILSLINGNFVENDKKIEISTINHTIRVLDSIITVLI